MCTQPILIKNRKYLNLDFNFSKSFVSVPCGKCEECLRKRANDIYVRTYFEYLSCIEYGGIGFMCTLTYDDSNVPVLYHLGVKYMVFNKEDVIKFVKRLRTNLDREYISLYGTSAPDFKYVITSEYGTSIHGTHRPHYHPLFLFHDYITPSLFRRCFVKSLYNRKTGKRYFGKIYQCDVIQPAKGGIKYSCKYILKDMFFNKTESIIKDKINFQKSLISKKFDLYEETNFFNKFHNKCIRSTKKYKSQVIDCIRLYSHMLQFYMCSNDLGSTAILNRYGNSLFSMCYLNINGFPFSIPKQVFKTLERTQGTVKRDELTKNIFLDYLSSQFGTLVHDGKLDKPTCDDLISFATQNLVFKYGSFYFASEYVTGFLHYPNDDELIKDYLHFEENGFIQKRDKIIKLLDSLNLEENRKFRASSAKRKSDRDKMIYENKKRNNIYNYGIF